MLNFNMLESRINAIEERYEKHGSQLKSDLREWFVSSFGNLESTVTTSLSEQQANLDEQHQHFTAACAQLERKLKVTEDQLRLKVEGVHRELTEAVESVERYGRDSVAKQNAHLDLALTEFSHEVLPASPCCPPAHLPRHAHSLFGRTALQVDMGRVRRTPVSIASRCIRHPMHFPRKLCAFGWGWRGGSLFRYDLHSNSCTDLFC